MSEVLITLGIIGVVAAITLSVLTANYKKMVLKNQFKNSYSIIYNAFKKAEADLGYSPQCYYWDKSPYPSGFYSCVQRNDEGNCIKYETADGGPIPSDINGHFEECTLFKDVIIKNLNVVKACQGKAYPDCIPEYEGKDTLKKTENEDLSDYDINVAISGCSGWKKSNLLNKNFVYVLADGQILISFNESFNPSIFAVDINGKKGPNKWGHDIFEFRSSGTTLSSLKLSGGTCMPVEKGGISSVDMIINMGK